MAVCKPDKVWQQLQSYNLFKILHDWHISLDYLQVHKQRVRKHKQRVNELLLFLWKWKWWHFNSCQTVITHFIFVCAHRMTVQDFISSISMWLVSNSSFIYTWSRNDRSHLLSFSYFSWSVFSSLFVAQTIHFPKFLVLLAMICFVIIFLYLFLLQIHAVPTHASMVVPVTPAVISPPTSAFAEQVMSALIVKSLVCIVFFFPFLLPVLFCIWRWQCV